MACQRTLAVLPRTLPALRAVAPQLRVRAFASTLPRARPALPQTRWAARRWCGSEAAPVAAGLQVTVEYKLSRKDTGEVINSSESAGGPLVFQCGSREVLPGLDKAVEGMRVGEELELDMTGADGFGERDERLVKDIPRDRLPENVAKGDQLQMNGPKGPIPAVVLELGSETASLDLNHPLAGVPLTMQVKVVDARKPLNEVRIDVGSPGDGKTFPKKGDKLTMHYEGRLAATGQVFDSSRARDEPIEFTIGVGQVIQGWEQGVIQMSLGERATLRIPASLGYGSKGAGGTIPPNADLVFDVELLKIN